MGQSVFSRCFPEDDKSMVLDAEGANQNYQIDGNENEEQTARAGISPRASTQKMQDSIAEAQAKMTGCWEMESQENYGAFLQYVCKLPGFIMSQIANQTYKQTFTFNGSIITIAIDGARKTSTDFEVGAEPIQIDMNKRKFRDVIGWSDKCELVIERNSEDGQVEIRIFRTIREDGKLLQETVCKAKDGTDIHATQLFKKIPPSS
mmetsp:Transcript_35236/g.51463  ORF Transcript_35236/g.51463 Transcript_35236/m.51463 type:complete len:205 (-) Transcript_35236:205-819(-)